MIAACRQALARLEAKKQVIADLILGRLALREASAQFSVLRGEAQPGEQTCRAVIGWAQLALSDRPEKAESFCTRLEKELQAYLTATTP